MHRVELMQSGDVVTKSQSNPSLVVCMHELSLGEQLRGVMQSAVTEIYDSMSFRCSSRL